MNPTSSARASTEAAKSAAVVPTADAHRGGDMLPDPSSTAPSLEVTDLRASLLFKDGRVNVARGINLLVTRGGVLVLVSESGLDKSVTSTAIMGLLGESAEIIDSMRLHGTELLGRPDDYMSRIRGSQVAMVSQDPPSTLTPMYTVGVQIVRVLRIHQPGTGKADTRKHAVELFDLVSIPNPQVCAEAYPHEFSGGMRQRTVIAIAIANDPDLIIVDEPTTVPDVTIQAQIPGVLCTAQEETDAGVIAITHGLGVMAGMAGRVVVMYAGRIVETGDVDNIFYRSRMPYMIGLLGPLPRLGAHKDSALATLEGNPPSLLELLRGRPFISRCPMVQARHAQGELELTLVGCEGIDGQEAGPGAQYSTYHRHDKTERDQPDYSHVYPAPALKTPKTMNLPYARRPEVLCATDLVEGLPLTKGAVFKRCVGTVYAVGGTSSDVCRGETLTLIGESGCSKTTTLMEVFSLQGPQEGVIVVPGKDVADPGQAQCRQVHRDLQIIFQDPMASLDPCLPIFDIIAKPLWTNGRKKADIGPCTEEPMEFVGLEPSHANRYPCNFSGGQRQRIGIAYALAPGPNLPALGEPVSTLDVSIRAGVINLLDELRATMGFSYLFMTHDLLVVCHVAGRVAAVYLGRTVEIGGVDTIFETPAHPYTQALFSTIPIPNPARERSRSRIVLEGNMPSPASPPSGCCFHTRCPKFVSGLTDDEHSACLRAMSEFRSQGEGHDVACHYPKRTAVFQGPSLPGPLITLSTDPIHRSYPPPCASDGILSRQRFP